MALHERSGSLRNFNLYAFFPSGILFGSKFTNPRENGPSKMPDEMPPKPPPNRKNFKTSRSFPSLPQQRNWQCTVINLRPRLNQVCYIFLSVTANARNFADASDLLIWRRDIFIFVLYSIWGWSVGGSVRVVREPGP